MAAVAALAVWLAAADAPAPAADTAILPPALAIPAYFWSPAQWSAISASGAAVSFAVANASSGPGAQRSDDQAAIFTAAAAATTLVGYVNTGYGGVPAASVLAQVDQWRNWYGVTSVFLDQVPADCGHLGYYAALTASIRQRQSGVIVLNPGANVDPCFAPVADVIVGFEGSAAAYRAWTPAAWTQAPRPGSGPRFWHVVYGADEGEFASVQALATVRHASYLYATPDVLPNPFDVLPVGSYWLRLVLMGAAGTGATPPAPATAAPSVTAVATTAVTVAAPVRYATVTSVPVTSVPVTSVPVTPGAVPAAPVTTVAARVLTASRPRPPKTMVSRSRRQPTTTIRS